MKIVFISYYRKYVFSVKIQELEKRRDHRKRTMQVNLDSRTRFAPSQRAHIEGDSRVCEETEPTSFLQLFSLVASYL